MRFTPGRMKLTPNLRSLRLTLGFPLPGAMPVIRQSRLYGVYWNDLRSLLLQRACDRCRHCR